MSHTIELEAARLARTGGGFARWFRPGFEHEDFAGSLDAPILIAAGSLRAAGPTSDGRVYVATTEFRAGWLS